MYTQDEIKFRRYIDNVMTERALEFDWATEKRFAFIKDKKVMREFVNSFARCWYEDELFAVKLAEEMGLNKLQLYSYMCHSEEVAKILEKEYEDCMGF